jgi:hypothetical protein
VVVLQEGDWRIHATAYSRFPAGDQYGDSETIHLISSRDSGMAVPGPAYRIAQEDPLQTVASQLSSSARILGLQAAAAGGDLTIEGIISYEAEEQDGTGVTPVSSILRRARVELWDFDLEGGTATKLASTNTSSSGFYTFTVANTDSDDTGLDPYLLVFADDNGAAGGQRARVIDESAIAFTFVYLVGTDLGEGTYVRSPTIPRSARESQAFYIFDQIANVANGFLLSETDWPASGRVDVRWPGGCFGVFDRFLFLRPVVPFRRDGTYPML